VKAVSSRRTPQTTSGYTPGNLHGYQNKEVAKFDGWKLLKRKSVEKCGKTRAIRKCMKTKGRKSGEWRARRNKFQNGKKQGTPRQFL
jgi:hypothetical protein